MYVVTVITMLLTTDVQKAVLFLLEDEEDLMLVLYIVNDPSCTVGSTCTLPPWRALNWISARTGCLWTVQRAGRTLQQEISDLRHH
jgi:hypothetical protein|eukprot:COSAG01_NODE_3629_length_5848_cov_127.580797_5_plen_86_part_00